MAMICCGIDEAGYGPLLGPLVVARSDFEATGSSGVRRRPSEHAAVDIGDSKRILGLQNGFARLETTVLAFTTAVSGKTPATVGDFIRQVDEASRPALARHEWYAGLDELRLPLEADPDEVARAAEAVGDDKGVAGGRFLGARLAILPEGLYNDRVEKTANKHDTLFGIVVDLIHDTLGREMAHHFVIDRLGGRTRYGGKLSWMFPFTPLEVEREDAEESRYLVELPDHDVRFRFVVKGDDRFVQVGLASMFAKYTREVLMHLFNAWWQERSPGIRATAGYYQDGHRFLDDLEKRKVLTPELRQAMIRVR